MQKRVDSTFFKMAQNLDWTSNITLLYPKISKKRCQALGHSTRDNIKMHSLWGMTKRIVSCEMRKIDIF